MMSMNSSQGTQAQVKEQRKIVNQNIQVYVRQRPLNAREHNIRSLEVVEVISPKEIMTRHTVGSKITKKFAFDRVFGANSRQVDVYSVVVAPLIDEVIAGYNCTVFAYGQTGTGKTHTMVGTACPSLFSSWDDDTDVGIIPRALSHLFDELRMMEVDFSMRISYLELYNEELCDLLSTDDTVRVRIFDDSTKKGSVIIHGLKEIPVHSKDDVYKLLEKGQERRKTATTLMNAQSSRSHTVFSILVHIRETGVDGEEMLKIGKLNLVDLAGSENATKAGTEKGIRVREAVNINQSLLTLGRVITALVERTPHIPYRESKLTRLLQESLGGRTKTSIIATISPGHKDIEETLSTLQYADRAKSIQNKPEVNQKLTKIVMLKEYSEEIEKLNRDLMAARDKNGIYLSEENFNEINNKMDAQQRELNEKMMLIKALKDEMQNKERVFNDLSENLVQKTTELQKTENMLQETRTELAQKQQVLNKTKKRYFEKKTLLEKHVRTEEVLTAQASEILTVADVATNDTQQLHYTIERRKNVDRQIEKTCDKFADQMQDHFEIFENNLKTLQEQHSTKVNLIQQVLSTNLKRQKEINTNVVGQAEYAIKVLGETTEKTTALEKTAASLIKNISEEHRQAFVDLFAKQKEIYDSQRQQVSQALATLMPNSDEQSALTNNMRQTMQSALQALNKEMAEFSHELKTDLAINIAFLQTCATENATLKQHIEMDYADLEEEKVVLQEFMQKMNAFSDKRAQQAQAKAKIVTQFESRYTSLQDNLTTCTNNASVFFEKQLTAKQTCQNEMETHFGQTESLNKAFKLNYMKLGQDNDAFVGANTQFTDELTKKENEHFKQIEGLLATQRINAENLRSERNEIHKTAIETLKAGVCDQVQKTTNEMCRVVSFTTDMEGSLGKYAAMHKEQINSCAADVEKFRKDELKTYAPTGTTPSKRDFVYPRVLAATSPHDQILKRMRQDNNTRSDLDVTGTIDEEDTELSLNQNSLLNSLQEPKNLSFAKNSTPVNKQTLSLSNANKENIPEEL